jgi:hypothetical protein
MTIAAGAKPGRYEIRSKIGVGGMARSIQQTPANYARSQIEGEK